MSVLSSLSRSWRLAVLGMTVAGIVIATGIATMTASNSQTASATVTQPGRIGIYGTRWAPWVAANPRVFDLLIFQLRSRNNDDELDMIASLTDRGVPVVVMQHIHKSLVERFMREGGQPDVPPAQVAAEIAAVYNDPRMRGIGAFSLDEENLWWDGRGEYLDAIYRETKALLPQKTILQWFNEHKRKRGVPRDARYAYAADGYILDPYSVPTEDYAERLRGYTNRARPIISVLWGSPEWDHGRRPEGRLADWWDEDGWREVYDKTRINRAAGVDTVFFMYDLPYGNENRLMPLFESSNPCSARFMQKFFTETVPALRSAPLTDPAPAQRPAWMSGRCG